jgi:hypothetical protein
MQIKVGDLYRRNTKLVFRVFRVFPLFVIVMVKLLDTKKEYSMVINKIDLINNYTKVGYEQ